MFIATCTCIPRHPDRHWVLIYSCLPAVWRHIDARVPCLRRNCWPWHFLPHFQMTSLLYRRRWTVTVRSVGLSEVVWEHVTITCTKSTEILNMHVLKHTTQKTAARFFIGVHYSWNDVMWYLWWRHLPSAAEMQLWLQIHRRLWWRWRQVLNRCIAI